MPLNKYTRMSGGNQDNQFETVLNLLKAFSNGRSEECEVLLAIVDGPYYTAEKMKDLYRFTKPPKSYALHIEDVPEILR